VIRIIVTITPCNKLNRFLPKPLYTLIHTKHKSIHISVFTTIKSNTNISICRHHEPMNNEVKLTVSSLQMELSCEQHIMHVNRPKRSASNTRNMMNTVVAAGENIGQSVKKSNVYKQWITLSSLFATKCRIKLHNTTETNTWKEIFI